MTNLVDPETIDLDELDLHAIPHSGRQQWLPSHVGNGVAKVPTLSNYPNNRMF
jgi:hypothetical protein